MTDGDKDRSSRDRSRRDRPARFSEASRDRSSDRGGRDRGSMKSSNNRVYVSNIPYEYRWQDMKDLFRNEVGDVQFVELFLDDNDKPKGCGIVEFSDSSLVKKCLEVMQRFEVKSRKLVVREDSGNMRDKHGNIVGGGGGGGGGIKRSRDDNRDRHRDDRDRHRDGGNNSLMMRQDDGVKWGNTYGLSPHFLESLNIEAPLSNKVFVANLEYNIDKKKLKEVFRIAGRVVRVDIHTDKDGRSRGFAVVEYDHPVEAVQAISMLHNQVLFDRTMTVRMDRANELLKLPEGLKTVGMGLGPNGEPLRNVSHNLPNSSNNQSQNVSGVGAGLLGAVPNNALQAAASALSGLNNVPGLGNINPSVLQAANLSGFASNLLQNGLGNAQDLSSLVQPNPLMQNTQQQLAALAASNASSNNLSSLGLNPSGGGYSFKTDSMSGRTNDNSGFNPNQPVSYPPTQSYASRNSGGYQDNMRSNSFTTPTSLLKSSVVGGGGGSGDSRGGSGNSRKVLISNLPPTANYQLLQDKLNEFGEVTFWEEKGTGSFLVVYGNEWQAERAIRNLDKARIDGRLVDARTYY